MRPRTPLEAADLGARLLQSTARPVYLCYVVVALPVMALCLASYEVAYWLPGLLLWWSKPWLDRTILFVLSRSAFGQKTTLGDLWRNQRQVWWRHIIHSLTMRRLSPWRSFTQPVYQLEGLSLWRVRQRVLQIRKRVGSAWLMTTAFSLAELALSFALLSLIFWFAPTEQKPDLQALFNDESYGIEVLMLYIPAAITILFLEPFYVAAGFAMYLNRRAELEAWDVEQEFRRAFGS